MDNVNFASALVPFESICCPIMEPLVKETAIMAARSLLWLMYLHANILETCWTDENFALKVINKSKKSDGEIVDDGKIEDGAGPNGCDGDANGENGNTFGEEGDGNGEGDDYEDDENDDASDEDGSYDSGEEEDGDDYDELGSDEEDDDEEYEDEDEEEDDNASSSEDDMDDEPLLIHAQQFYASDSFYIFEHEYKKSRALSLDVTHEHGSAKGLVFSYKVRRMGHFYSHEHKVTALAIDGIVNCCCNYFAVTGILCSHALAVLQCLQIEKIPDCYLLKWRMNSRNDSSMDHLFFQKRRNSRPSLDDCLSGDLGKGSVDSNAFEDDVCTDADHSGAPVLRHAKYIYVSEIYDLFREEYKKSQYLITHIGHETIDGRGIVTEFEVHGYGGRGKTKVYAETNDGTVNCSCRKFEHSGVLCSHALAVLDSLCIVRIPPKYIVPKFLKDANISGTHEKIHGPRYCELERFTRYRVMQRMAFKSGLKDVFQYIIEDGLHETESKLRDLPEDHNEEESTTAKQEKEFKGQANFYGDQLMKSFTYKNSETRKRKLFELLNMHQRSR